MQTEGAAFAGELSGHYYFRDFYGADSGLYAFILLSNVISSGDGSLYEQLEPLRKYHHTGEINFKVANPKAAFARAKSIPGTTAEESDGIMVRAQDWWFNLRASNTEPVVRLNLEADSADLQKTKLAEISKLIES